MVSSGLIGVLKGCSGPAFYESRGIQGIKEPGRSFACLLWKLTYRIAGRSSQRRQCRLQ